MKIRLSILIASAGVFLAALFGCNSETSVGSAPREIVGIFRYTGATYNPVHISTPFRYAIYDINGVFLAYVDTSKIVTPEMNSYLDKLVLARGCVDIIDGDNVLRADYIRPRH